MQDRISKASRGAGLAAHKLDALAHRNMTGSIQIQHLKGGDTQSRTNTSRYLPRLCQVRVKSLVEAARCGGDPQSQSRCKGKITIVCRQGESDSLTRQDVTHKGLTVLSLHQGLKGISTRR